MGAPSVSTPPAATERPSAFSIEPAPLDGAPGVRVCGEVDIATAPGLTTALDGAMRGSAGAFVVDLGDVTFVDSSAVSALLRARAFLGREERDLVVVCPPGASRRIFEVAGITDLFALFDSRDAAAASLRPVR
jgi:anti-sigma B factor antagonist